MAKEIIAIELEGNEASALERFTTIISVVNTNQFVSELPSPQKRPLKDVSYYSYNRDFGLDLTRQGKKWVIRAIPLCLLDDALSSYIEGVVRCS